MKRVSHSFGGSWTKEKLKRVQKYLAAYATILNKKGFKYAYIDAFAGTGYRLAKGAEKSGENLFPELVDEETREFIEGSATIALQIVPRFSKYIFIEKKGKHIPELQKLKERFPSLAADILIKNEEANDYLKRLCTESNWSGHRAVMFLDPFGMQVKWETIQAIASTGAIDLWILFPLGVAVNRLLKKDGMIDDAIKDRLNEMFGSSDWYDAFYKERTSEGLFGAETSIKKVGNFRLISEYFVKRLETIFVGVAKNPLPLYNSKGVPLYLLCFVASNRAGATVAIKIAQDILQG